VVHGIKQPHDPPQCLGSYSGAWVLKDAIFSVSRGKRRQKIDARYAN
jgi:hypothetical protein